MIVKAHPPRPTMLIRDEHATVSRIRDRWLVDKGTLIPPCCGSAALPSHKSSHTVRLLPPLCLNVFPVFLLSRSLHFSGSVLQQCSPRHLG